MVLIAAVLAFLMYFKDKNYLEIEKWKSFLLMGLRFFAILFVLLLIFDPLIRNESDVTEKPLIIFVQDNSASITLNRDSVYYKNQYPTVIRSFLKDLSNDYKVVQINFGAHVREDSIISFNDKLSNISEIFPSIIAAYSGMNVGAVVLASDGLFNTGSNPLYVPTGNFPIYTLALGDTNAQKDVYINNVRNNKLAFYNNLFPVQITVAADRCKDIPVDLKIICNEQILFSKQLIPDKENYFEQIDVELLANEIGIHEYEIRIEPVEGEISRKNNVSSFVVDIIDNRNKILFVVNSPHPDIGAMVSVLDENPNFETVIHYIGKGEMPDISDFDLLVLHQLPSISANATRLLSDIERYKLPVLFILGPQSSLQAFNQLSTGLELNFHDENYDDVVPVFNNGFTAFTISEEMKEQLEKYSPLKVPFADYSFTTDAQVLLYQRIGKVITDKPLFAFVNKGDFKYGFITGTGIWQWRIHDFQLNTSHEMFSNLINRTIQFLITQRMKQKLLVETQRIVSDNEPIIFKAELYNEAYERYNEPDVELKIIDEDGNEFVYSMNHSIDAYNLNIGNLKSGAYSYSATAEFEGIIYEDAGELFVKDLNIESLRTKADHALLYSLASDNAGQMFYPQNINNLKEALQNNDEIVTKMHVEKKLSSIINLIWIFFIILLLLAGEWFLRKFWGAY